MYAVLFGQTPTRLSNGQGHKPLSKNDLCSSETKQGQMGRIPAVNLENNITVKELGVEFTAMLPDNSIQVTITQQIRPTMDKNRKPGEQNMSKSLWIALRKHWPMITIAAVGCTLKIGCAVPSFSLGVTGGGVQDIDLARSAILAGRIPDADTITVEGMLSEHDIPIPTPEDAGTLYAGTALAWRQPYGTTTSASLADVIVRFGSTINLESFQRRPQNIALVIDRSGSMAGAASAGDFGSRMDCVRQGVLALLDQLNEGDSLSIITFNQDARIELSPRAPVDRELIEGIIENIEPSGRTDIEEALTEAFDLLEAATLPERDNRVLLFTDALPTSGAEDANTFIELLQSGADRNIGVSVFGVGINFGFELSQEITQVRGANVFYIANGDCVGTLFDDEFDFLVTPLAYDVVLDVSISEGIGIQNVYGVPDYIPGATGARIELPTLFASRRSGGGAIIVRLTLNEAPFLDTDLVLASLDLSYQPIDSDAEMSQFDVVLPAGTPSDGVPAYFSDDAAKRAAIVMDTALVLQEGAEAGGVGRYEDAAELLEGFLPYFDKTILGMSDRTEPTSRGLSEERDLVEALLGTMQRFAQSLGSQNSRL